MPKAYITTPEEIEEATERALERLLEQRIPSLIRKGTSKRWLTITEATEYLGISRRKLQYLRDSRQIPYSQTGKTIRFDIEELDAFLQRNKIPERPEQ